MHIHIRLKPVMGIGNNTSGEAVIVPPSYTPALQFNEAKNSMYLVVIGV